MSLGSFPLQTHPLRSSLINVVSGSQTKPFAGTHTLATHIKGNPTALAKHRSNQVSDSVFNVCTAVVCATTYVLALMVHDLGQ
ncbi:hypothetical protein SARC_17798, partial [Sphaeroforma arctica JP610]